MEAVSKWRRINVSPKAILEFGKNTFAWLIVCAVITGVIKMFGAFPQLRDIVIAGCIFIGLIIAIILGLLLIGWSFGRVIKWILELFKTDKR